MFKNALLGFALALPLAATALAPSIQTKEVPMPECLPCKAVAVPLAREVPMPECLPCQATVAAVREVPMPECLPCQATVAAIREVPMPECLPCKG